MSLIDISEIHKYTQNPNIKHEIGGTFKSDKNKLEFTLTSVGNAHTKNRSFVSLPNEGMIWHTHPHSSGFWPSFEDINRNNSKHILFSKYGVWVFDKNPVKNDKVKVNVMRQSYDIFHKFMEQTTQGIWTTVDIQKKIDMFIKTMRVTYGFEISFIPDWSINPKTPRNINIIKRVFKKERY